MFIATEKLEGRKRNRSIKDYSGMRWGRLTAVALALRSETRDHKWRFACDCGGEIVTNIKLVKAGKTSSCGCLFREMMAARNTTHGLSSVHQDEYRIWKNMRARCQSPTNKSFPDYGGRGIAVCERWQDFANFIADMGPRPSGASLDRVDVNSGYGPENCRWVGAVEQANNKRNNRVIEWGGVAKTLQQWCAEYGVEPSKVRYRLSQGMTLEAALTSGDLRRNGRRNSAA